MFGSNRIGKASSGRRVAITSRPRRRARTVARGTFEQLEDRQLLATYGDAVMAVFSGEVTHEGKPSTTSIVIAPEEFELTKGTIMLGFQVNASDGSDLAPLPAVIRDAAGNRVQQVAGKTVSQSEGQSLVLVSVGYGTYQVDVLGAKGTVGPYELATSLVGDVDGDRAVTEHDAHQLRGLLNTSSKSPAYDVDADVNQDGRITGFDLSLLERNLTTSTSSAVQLTFEIDPSVAPEKPPLPPLVEGDTAVREMAKLVDKSGEGTTFVVDELIVVTSDMAELDEIVQSLEGEVVKTLDPSAGGLEGIEKLHVVRVKTDQAEVEKLPQDLRKLDPNAQGKHKVSSEDGLKMLAVASKLAAEGKKVALNTVSEPNWFLDRESIEGEFLGGGSVDAFDLHHLAISEESNQDTGVAEAWRALELGGKLGPSVNLAILDQGFSPNADWPLDYDAFSTIPLIDPTGVDLGSGWHGSKVFAAAAGRPDNHFGSAGVAGPVVNPQVITTSYDFFTGLASLIAARAMGADIINMSFGTRIPAAFFWTATPLNLMTDLLRAANVLVFASAGDRGEDLNAKETFLGAELWEKAFYAPAESPNVISVGALNYNSQTRTSSSNFGVDIYAPGVFEVGPNPDNPASVQLVNGTSFASPFAAGVAALIWAADPTLSANEVHSILYDTAAKNPHVSVNQYVNALDAVLAAIGDVPPYVEITGPADGSSFSRGSSVPLNAEREDYEDGLLNVVLTSDRDGVVGSSPADLSYGTHIITATVTDSAGQSSSDSITIEILNDHPEVELVAPLPGATVYTGFPIQFSATSHDVNETSQMLEDNDMVWTSNIDGALGTGHTLFATLTTLGEHLISIEGTDSQGASAVVVFNVNVLEPVGGIPEITFVIPTIGDPSEVVIFLTGADEIGWYADVRLVANATDPEDGQLHGAALQWTLSETENGPQESIGEGDALEYRIYVDDPTGDVVFITLTATDSDGQSQLLTLTIRLFGLI